MGSDMLISSYQLTSAAPVLLVGLDAVKRQAENVEDKGLKVKPTEQQPYRKCG